MSAEIWDEEDVAVKNPKIAEVILELEKIRENIKVISQNNREYEDYITAMDHIEDAIYYLNYNM